MRRALKDGFYGALLTGAAGAGFGVAIPLGLDILNAAANPSPPTTLPIYSSPDASYTDALFPALSIYLGVGGGIVGGVVFFFEGLTAPATRGCTLQKRQLF